MLRVIEAVTHDPFVADTETDVVDGYVDLGAFRLVQQCGGSYGGRAMRLEDADQVFQRVPGIDDVLDDEYVAVLDVAAYVHHEAHRTGGNTAGGVAGNGDKLDRARDRKLS
mgnify:CR=1 FL=1